MQYHLDTIFWAYFGEYIQKNVNFSLKKMTIENKQKINEVYDVAYFALFQYKLMKNDTISELEIDQYDDFANYVTDHYKAFYTYINGDLVEKSKFDLENEEDIALIKEIITKLVLLHIAKTSFIDSSEKYSYNYYWLSSSLFSLATKLQYDLAFSIESDKLYYSIVYPFLTTCILIDVFNPRNILKKIQQTFTKSNIAYAFKFGRDLSIEEKKWVLPLLTLLKNESDWNAFLLSFSKENWESYDIHQRFKLIHQLSKLTTLFLKENIKKISFIGDGDEIWSLISNYLIIFLPLTQSEREKELKNHSNMQLSALFTSNTRDYNSKWTYQHSTKFREYKKNGFSEERICNFIYRLKYAIEYVDFISKSKNHNEIVATQLINWKSTGLVDTLKIYKAVDNKYDQINPLFDFYSINLDIKKFEQLLKKRERFEEIADPNSQMSIMLKAITLLICIDYKAPKFFNYSLFEMIKYYVIIFGPYKKNTISYTIEDIEIIDAKVQKLLVQYEKLKNKELVLDTIGVLYKLQNFSQ